MRAAPWTVWEGDTGARVGVGQNVMVAVLDRANGGVFHGPRDRCLLYVEGVAAVKAGEAFLIGDLLVGPGRGATLATKREGRDLVNELAGVLGIYVPAMGHEVSEPTGLTVGYELTLFAEATLEDVLRDPALLEGKSAE